MDIVVAEGSDWCQRNCAKYREEYAAKQELLTAMYEIAVAVDAIDGDVFSPFQVVMRVKELRQLTRAKPE